MNNWDKTILIFLCLLLSINGCAHDKFTERVVRGMANDMEKNLVPDMNKVVIALQVFDKENNRFPEDYNELEDFTRKKGMDLELKSMQKIKIYPVGDQEVAVEYDYSTPALSNIDSSREVLKNRQRMVFKRTAPK